MAELILKPCPFCGSRASIHLTFGKAIVGCSGEKPCRMKPDTWSTGVETTDLSKVAKIWNSRRADPDPKLEDENHG